MHRVKLRFSVLAQERGLSSNLPNKTLFDLSILFGNGPGRCSLQICDGYKKPKIMLQQFEYPSGSELDLPYKSVLRPGSRG